MASCGYDSPETAACPDLALHDPDSRIAKMKDGRTRTTIADTVGTAAEALGTAGSPIRAPAPQGAWNALSHGAVTLHASRTFYIAAGDAETIAIVGIERHHQLRLEHRLYVPQNPLFSRVIKVVIFGPVEARQPIK